MDSIRRNTDALSHTSAEHFSSHPSSLALRPCSPARPRATFIASFLPIALPSLPQASCSDPVPASLPGCYASAFNPDSPISPSFPSRIFIFPHSLSDPLLPSCNPQSPCPFKSFIFSPFPHSFVLHNQLFHLFLSAI